MNPKNDQNGNLPSKIVVIPIFGNGNIVQDKTMSFFHSVIVHTKVLSKVTVLQMQTCSY